MTLLAGVRRTIRERALIPAGSTVLCACSGGPDSAALLACLARLSEQLRFTLQAASVDHGLRPDADVDVQIAAAQAATCGVPFHALAVRVEAGASIQARARAARYTVLRELAARVGATRIAVGHTQDDQAETVLGRLLRGASVRGLGAIRPLRADGVVRPLIDCRRDDVHRFAHACFGQVAHDRSNLDRRFERVRIRSQVVPALETEDRALVVHLSQLADDARECASLIEALAEPLFEQALSKTETETLEISAIVSQPAALRKAVLRKFVERVVGAAAIGRAELTQLDHILRNGRGEVWLRAGRSVYAHRAGQLRIREHSGRTPRETSGTR
jgi:tRNA(Ile)-lysidine synthase